MDPDIQELVAATKRKPADGLQDVLAKLTECLGQKSLQDDEYLEKFKQDIFNNGILNYCANALRLNFSKVNGGIKTAVRLADIISACCVGVGDVNNTECFRNKFLLLVANNMLFLSDSLMKKALRVKSDGERTRLFRRVMDSLSWVLRDHHHLIPHVIDSEHFENIQLCEDEDVAEILLALWMDLFSTKSSNIIVDIGDEALNVILDDLMYKMSNFQNPVIGRSAVKILMHIINHDNSMLQVLLTRYRGLAEMVVKDWRGKGFDPVLDRLVGLLKLPPPSRHTDAKGVSAERVRAACVIQAAWRAHQTRRRLRKLPRVITRLQRSFRERKRREEECVERRRAEEELRLQLQLRRQTANRLFRQRQLNLMEQLPADQVRVYLGEVERRAAMLIQRVWRGHRERRSFQRRRYHLQRHKAANTIQRAVLRFLERCRAQKANAAPWRGFKKITDERREELQKEIDEYLYIHSKHGVSEQRCREVHNSTQMLLRDWLKSRQEAEKQQQHTQALLAQINTDMELLLNAPSLKDSTSSDCSVFRSRCGPVAARARQCHSAMTRAASLPWWQRLTWDALNADLFHADAHGHHADDPDDAFADDGWELPTLYRGGLRRHDNGNDGVPPPPSVPRLLYPGRTEDDTDTHTQDGATRSRTASPYPGGIPRHDRDIQQAQLYPGGIRDNIDTQTSMAQLYRGSMRDAQDSMAQQPYPGGIRDTQDRMAQREVAQPYYGGGMQRSTDMAWHAGTQGMAAHRPMPSATAQYQGEEGAIRHDMGDTANALIRRLRESVTTQETY
ncbi:IQ calmodulin-binding motif-containing protein 1 [Engraulis encrasicolus]|uniref:IQ calmodulin-binding motif-containing protein 1 n=1 Tax=Engraulis encrasicolus TaxID=184585 RepID=UPI002FD608D2